jgi:hypothetical protein
MERAFLDRSRGQVETSDLHAWIGANGPADNVGGSDYQASSQIYALASRRFRWMPDDVDGVDAQPIVRVLGMHAQKPSVTNTIAARQRLIGPRTVGLFPGRLRGAPRLQSKVRAHCVNRCLP